MDSHSILQRIFPTQGSNPVLHCRQILYCLSHLGSPLYRTLPRVTAGSHSNMPLALRAGLVPETFCDGPFVWSSYAQSWLGETELFCPTMEGLTLWSPELCLCNMLVCGKMPLIWVYFFIWKKKKTFILTTTLSFLQGFWKGQVR